MDECNSPAKDSSSVNLSVNDRVMTLSPVLGSGQSVKKFRKRIKKPCKTVKKKLETQFHTQNEPLGIVEYEGEPKQCLQDRIRQLETMHNQRLETVKKLSFQSPEIKLVSEESTNSTLFLPVVVKNQVCELKGPECLKQTQSNGFTTGWGKPINLSLQQEQKSRQLFEDILNPEKTLKPPEKKLNYLRSKTVMTPGNTDSLNNSKTQTQNKTHKTINIFENECFSDLSFSTDFQSFTSAKTVMTPGKTDSLKAETQNNANILENETKNNLKPAKSVKNIFENEDFNDLNLKSDFEAFKSVKDHLKSVESCGLKPSKIVKNIFENESFEDLGEFKLRGFQPVSLKTETTNSDIDIFKGESLSDLGFLEFKIPKLPEGQALLKGFSCKEQQSSLSKLLKIRNLLDPKPKTPKLNVTPVQTKKRLGCRISPTVQLSEPTLKRARLLFEDLKPCHTSTPVKHPIEKIQSPVTGIRKESQPSGLVLLAKTTQGDVKGWLEDLKNERHRLEERLRVVDQRSTILTNQKTLMEFSSRAKVSPGVLSKAKTRLRKSFLNKLTTGNTPEPSVYREIGPQNALLVHFTLTDSESHLTTRDGAVIVPDCENRVGLAQIEFGFKAMDTVDSDLLPKNWIQNHFKWIVWKLASYDRMCAGQFDRCLTVENVVQQLKYRYDREIDKAERPIVRRILEKDDTSQRRMILCVANIKLNSELELTDGWYPIRTVLDAPLRQQIKKGKIYIGQKLLIYGAELKNCEEGCHPLEAPPSVYLQINFNTTRRALWWCKLGAQKQSGPFLLPLSGISLDGGKIGRIQCLIVRVYPLKYLDKSGGTNVWRNRKAQERYNPQADLSNVKDPQVLYDMLQNSGDPEGLQEMLSTTQKTALYNYMGGAVKRKTSNVTPLLVIKMADAHQNGGDLVYDFCVWRPSECHFDELKEGAVVTIFNVSCTPKWGLSAGPSTQFKRESGPENRFEKFRRKVTEISELPNFRTNVNWSDEFDTVGLVVMKTITETDQEVWLADVKQNLLRITINHPPSNVLVLDGISDGQLISTCNLTFVQHWYSHCQATGGWSVIFTRYSQYSHLKSRLELLEEEFSQIDKIKFLQECREKVMAVSNQQADEMECSQITLTDRALLECIEKLN